MSLEKSIFELNSFQTEYQRLVYESVISQFDFERSELTGGDYDWHSLLSCASILAYSDTLEHLDAALRIAQFCIDGAYTTEEEKGAAAIVFGILTNRPAIQLAKKRNKLMDEYEQKLPFVLQLSNVKTQIEHRLILNGDHIIDLNRFQKEVYEQFTSNKYISISAPTSAGKSFILTRLILLQLTEHVPCNMIYIVPTRALINQVETELRDLIVEYKLKNVEISSLPQLDGKPNLAHSHIFVFTQERLHWFRAENIAFKFDLLIVDEAQNIKDGSRGIVLQQKIEEITQSFPDMKVIFSSPYSKNPEILFSAIAADGSKAPVTKEYAAVNQNLIYVSQVSGDSKRYRVELCNTQEKKELGFVKFDKKLAEGQKLPLIAHKLAPKEGANLIYVNGASDAEKVAMHLAEKIQQQSPLPEKISRLIDLLKKAIHPDYVLISVLPHRVAFHYGNMPVIVRAEIEQLFKENYFDFLVCTSTLLEGVNLPGKSIFIRRPTKGKGNHLSNADFWNLAGRAGRMGKEFQGNIICIDPEDWPNTPSIQQKKQEISLATEEIDETTLKLIDYIKLDAPRNLANEHPHHEYAFTYYFAKFLTNDWDRVLKTKQELKKELLEEFKRIRPKIILPESIILKNMGISPLAQQALYDFFNHNISTISNYIPVAPSERLAAPNSYKPLIETINLYLSGDTDHLSYPMAILVVNWMRGYSLPYIINLSVDGWKSIGQDKKMGWVIRDTMEKIEKYVRFSFAKYSTCYIDILRFCLAQNNRTELIDRIPKLSMWLEYGVNQQTQLSLIGLGLSRSSAIELATLINSPSLDRKACLQWLRLNSPAVPISEILRTEISRVVNSTPEQS